MQWTDVLKDRIKYWKNIGVPVSVFDVDFMKYPEFISMSLKDLYEGRLDIRFGHVSYNNIKHQQGLFMNAYIGDNKQGCGTSGFSQEEVGVKPRGVVAAINKGMDGVIKTSASAYLELVSSNIHDNAIRFRHFGEAPVVTHEEDMSLTDVMMPSPQEVKRFENIMQKYNQFPFLDSSLLRMRSYREHRRFVNSEGTSIMTNNLRGYGVFTFGVRDKNGAPQLYTENFLYENGWDAALVLEREYKRISKHLNEIAKAEYLEPGHYPVIFDPHAFGTFFHEAIIAHLLSGEYISHGFTNTFARKLGKRVMPEFLSIKIEPNSPNGYGSFMYDEEGVRSVDEWVVKKGILTGYLLHRESTSMMNRLLEGRGYRLKNNGHARQEWVKDEDGDTLFPEPRISNFRFKVDNPLSKKELFDMMRRDCERHGLEFGLFVSARAGEVDIEKGKFELLSSFLQKIYVDGRVETVTGGNFHGMPFELLDSIKACATPYARTIGHCGASSGMVPTQEISPYAYFPSVEFQEECKNKFTERLG